MIVIRMRIELTLNNVQTWRLQDKSNSGCGQVQIQAGTCRRKSKNVLTADWYLVISALHEWVDGNVRDDGSQSVVGLVANVLRR
jgi:hypothetical protein